MVQYTIDIYVDDWSGYGSVPDAVVTIDGISKTTGSDGYVQFTNVNEGSVTVSVIKSGYTDYIYEFYLDENKTMGVPFKKVTCTSQPECEYVNGNLTGYMLDGCGGKFLSPFCTPQCIPNPVCELDENNKNTGYVNDGCGEHYQDITRCPTICIPNSTCEINSDGYNTGYRIDGCGSRVLDPTCNCVPLLECQKDEDGNNTGYEVDGCGVINLNLIRCPLPMVCLPITCSFIIE